MTKSGARATRGKREPPSDAEIERGLRERAVSDPRAAEILLRWQQRPRETSDADELEGLTLEQLEALYAALLRLSTLTPEEQATVVRGLLGRHTRLGWRRAAFMQADVLMESRERGGQPPRAPAEQSQGGREEQAAHE